MSFTQHNLYPCTLAGTALGTLNELKIDPKIAVEIQRAAGSLFPLEAFVADIDSLFKLKTPDIKKLLTATVSGGIGIDLTAGRLLGTSSPSLFQFRKRAAGGWASGSNHFNLKSFNGFTYIERIEAVQSEKKKAVASVCHVPLTDTSGNYLLPQGSQALTGSVGMSNYGYAFGPLYIDVSGSPVQVDGNMKFTFDSGLKFNSKHAAGDVHPRQGTTGAVTPKISFSVVEMLDLLTWGMSLAYVENVTQYLIAIDENGNRYGPSETEHMSISFPTAKLAPSNIDGGEENVDSSLDYDCTLIGETVTVSFGVALP